MKTLGFIFSFIFSMSVWADMSVVGKWKTINEEGQSTSVVEITQDGETIIGKVIQITDPSKAAALCDKCKGDNAHQPILGMQILTGLKETKKGEEWSGGQILDPKNGKTYKCLLHPKAEGKKLEVRGYIGFSLLGRTQVWEKAD